MTEWTAEIDLDERQVRSLIAAQFPSVSLEGLAPLAAGWDNAVWATGDGILFRIPRRSIAVAGVRREIGVLPVLAPLLPLPIPVPVWIGTPSDVLPWPFFGAQLVPGREIADVPLDGRRTAFGSALGTFLRALHDPTALGVIEGRGLDLPRDPMGRADMAARVPRTRTSLEALSQTRLWEPSSAADEILGAALDLGPANGRVLAHGDLHVRHVLVDEDGRPSGVIDWGDLCVGDPSIDLSLYWSVLDAAGRAAFRAAYGEDALTHERLLRARVLALFLDSALATYAHDVRNDALLRQTISDLERTLRD